MKIHRFFAAFLFVLSTSIVLGQTTFDPTGTYVYKGKTIKKNGDTYGYSGTIQVKKIADEKIVITFEICKGAPSYNLGGFFDTLQFINNESIYTTKYDSTCKITLHFEKKGILIKEETADYNWGCGFGHAVVADGYFSKTSSKSPKLTMPLSGEDIK